MKRESAKKPAPEYVVTGFTCPPTLLAKGREKAKSQRRSFSAYVALLIEKDLSVTNVN